MKVNARTMERFVTVEEEMRADLAARGMVLKERITRGSWYVEEIGNRALWQHVDIIRYANAQQIREAVLLAAKGIERFIVARSASGDGREVTA